MRAPVFRCNNSVLCGMTSTKCCYIVTQRLQRICYLWSKGDTLTLIIESGLDEVMGKVSASVNVLRADVLHGLNCTLYSILYICRRHPRRPEVFEDGHNIVCDRSVRHLPVLWPHNSELSGGVETQAADVASTIPKDHSFTKPRRRPLQFRVTCRSSGSTVFQLKTLKSRETSVLRYNALLRVAYSGSGYVPIAVIPSSDT